MAELILVVFALKIDMLENGVMIMKVEADHMLILHDDIDEITRATFVPGDKFK